MKLSFLSLAVACLLTTHAFAASNDISTRVAKAAHEVSQTASSEAAKRVQGTLPTVAQSGAQAVGPVSQAASSIATSGASVINNVVDKASAGLGEITKRLEAAAPDAWKLVVSGTKAKAEASLFVGLLAGLSAFFSWMMFSSHFKKADFDQCTRYNATSMAFFGLAVLSSITASMYLLNSDAWAAYLSPEGILALGILNMALSHT